MAQLTHAALDLIFEPRGATTKGADVGFQVGGVDISNRYMYASQGGTANAANTGFTDGGVDIADIFAALGTAVPDVVFSGSFDASALVLTTGRAEVEIRTTGDIWEYSNPNGTRPTGADQGNWVAESDKSGLDSTQFEWRVGERTGTGPSLTGDAVAPPTGANTFSAWQNFDNNAGWFLSSSFFDICTFTLEIRADGDDNNKASATVSISIDA